MRRLLLFDVAFSAHLAPARRCPRTSDSSPSTTGRSSSSPQWMRWTSSRRRRPLRPCRLPPRIDWLSHSPPTGALYTGDAAAAAQAEATARAKAILAEVHGDAIVGACITRLVPGSTGVVTSESSWVLTSGIAVAAHTALSQDPTAGPRAAGRRARRRRARPPRRRARSASQRADGAPRRS